jgi:hypothetical protein
MTDFPGIFREVLRSNGVLAEIHSIDDKRKVVDIRAGERQFTAFFNGSKNDYLSIRCEVMNVPFEKKGEIVLLCNKLNSLFRFVKIYIDNDNDIMICCDVHLPEENTADIAYEAFLRILLYVERNIEVIRNTVY